jgi:hypothetical protein
VSDWGIRPLRGNLGRLLGFPVEALCSAAIPYIQLILFSWRLRAPHVSTGVKVDLLLPSGGARQDLHRCLFFFLLGSRSSVQLLLRLGPDQLLSLRLPSPCSPTLRLRIRFEFEDEFRLRLRGKTPLKCRLLFLAARLTGSQHELTGPRYDPAERRRIGSPISVPACVSKALCH